ncbi:MAG: acyl-CoA synthetase [Verrucomicrobia bacterium]|nr:acyl-CoA synthetase [Verrucomicrobiota bacterium]
MGTIWNGTRAITATEIHRRARQAAAGFESLGVGPGDGVAIYLRNDYPFFEASIGAGLVGAYPVAVNWHYTPTEAHYLLEDSRAKVLVIHADLYNSIHEIVPPELTVLQVAVPSEIQSAYGLTDLACQVPAGNTNWENWRDGFQDSARPPAQMPSTIIYTSGTTGHPKGVKRPSATTQQKQVAMRMLAQCYGFTDYLERGQDVTTAIVGPIYHSAPNTHANFCFVNDANIVMLPRFDPEDLLRQIEQRKITHLNMVPIMFNRLLKLPAEVRGRYDVSSLEFVAHAAAPVSPPIKQAMIEWWGPVINEYYGSTEMGNITFCTTEEWLAHPGTVGRPMTGAVVRVVDENGNELPPREIGEVIGRTEGSSDFTYQNDPAKRRQMEKQGLFAPGDIGYFDEDGFLYLCDRASDMIISGGVNIYPAEIEAELHKMPEIADCAVFGIPDEEFGEAVCAYIQPQPGIHLEEAELRTRLREQVAGYKMPKVWEFAAELPREDSGKIFKRKLRAPYWEHAGRTI